MGSMKTDKQLSKEFVDTLKSYFSSLSARGAKYLFLNVANLKNTFVISNGDYEMLTAYIPVMLSFHVIQFKDTNFFTKFLEFLNLRTDKPYVIRMSQILKAIKHNKFDDLTVIYDDYNKMRLALTDSVIVVDENTAYTDEDLDDEIGGDDEDEDNPFVDNSKYETITFQSVDVCGQPIDNLYALTILEDTVLEMVKKEEQIHEQALHHSYIPVSVEVNYFHGNCFRLKVELQQLLFPNDTPEHVRVLDNLYAVLFDGLDVPSIKEFIKKRKTTTDLQLLLWCNNGKTIQHMAMYDDENISILSMRPFHQVVIPKTSTISN